MILSRKYGMVLIMAIIIFIPNVCAIKMSVSGNGVSYSGDYIIDKDAALNGHLLLGDEGIFHETSASGEGDNSIIQTIGGSGYNGKTIAKSSGRFIVSSSSIVTSNSGTISQEAFAEGDATAMVSASANGERSMQFAEVEDGTFETSQNLAAGSGTITSQNTNLVGGNGAFDSMSQGDRIESVSGYYEGGGNLEADIASISYQSTAMRGTAVFNGLELIDNSALYEIEAQEGGMIIEGLTSGSTRFATSAKVVDLFSGRSISSTSTQQQLALQTVKGILTDQGPNPEIIGTMPGNPDAFVLNNRMINPNNPIQLWLRSDSNLKAEGLDPSSTAQSISLAANTWDYYTKPNQNNLFKESVIIDPNKKADTRDGYSTHAFLPINNPAFIAYARSWYSGKYIVETDVCYNTAHRWTTDSQLSQDNGRIKEVQTLALHELGHAVGLGDLYSLPANDPRIRDYKEIMSGYHGLQHSLGAGDLAGLQKKYGA
jgi:hypothetical protein